MWDVRVGDTSFITMFSGPIVTTIKVTVALFLLTR